MAKRHLVGASVEGQLDAALTGLLGGVFGLHDLTPALAGFYSVGYDAGRASLEGELERARDEAARWYEIAHHPGAADYPDFIRRRLDAAAGTFPLHASDTAQYESLLIAASSPRRAA